MSDDASTAPRELPLLVGPARGDTETLLLIGAPRGGQVMVRHWTAADWSAPATPRRELAAVLLQWIEEQAAAGRTLNQSVYALRLWLTGDDNDNAPRTS